MICIFLRINSCFASIHRAIDRRSRTEELFVETAQRSRFLHRSSLVIFWLTKSITACSLSLYLALYSLDDSPMLMWDCECTRFPCNDKQNEIWKREKLQRRSSLCNAWFRRDALPFPTLAVRGGEDEYIGAPLDIFCLIMPICISNARRETEVRWRRRIRCKGTRQMPF